MAESIGEAVAVTAVATAVADAVPEPSAEEEVAVAEEAVVPAPVDTTPGPEAVSSEAEIVTAIETLPAEGSVTIPAPEVAAEVPEVVADEHAADGIVEAPAETVEESSEVVPAVTVVVQDESGETAVAVETPAVPEDATAPAEPVARPKSPWTPSYSVVRQGSGSVPPEEVEELEQLPPPVAAEVTAEPEVAEITIPVPVILTEVVEESASDLPAEEVSFLCYVLFARVLTSMLCTVEGRRACGGSHRRLGGTGTLVLGALVFG